MKTQDFLSPAGSRIVPSTTRRSRARSAVEVGGVGVRCVGVLTLLRSYVEGYWEDVLGAFQAAAVLEFRRSKKEGPR